MSHPWPEIAETLAGFAESASSEPIRLEYRALAGLAEHIGARHKGLFGWTSLGRLVVNQRDGRPFEGPHLLVSSQAGAGVLFEHMAAGIDRTPWQRTVPPDKTVERFERFLDQLHWLAPPKTAAKPKDKGPV